MPKSTLIHIYKCSFDLCICLESQKKNYERRKGEKYMKNQEVVSE